jgi:hypothetical protein
MRCNSHLSDDEREQIGLLKALGHSIQSWLLTFAWRIMLVTVPDAGHFDVVTTSAPAWRLVSERIVIHIRREIVPVIHCDFLSMYPPCAR